jgi:hypothetical protein
MGHVWRRRDLLSVSAKGDTAYALGPQPGLGDIEELVAGSRATGLDVASSGFLLKDLRPEDLPRAVRTILSYETGGWSSRARGLSQTGSVPMGVSPGSRHARLTGDGPCGASPHAR